jgi:hypothetical protein
MEFVKGIFDSLRITLYEWLAILLPGVVCIESLRFTLLPAKNLLPGSTKLDNGIAILGSASIVVYLVIAYILGIAVQGLSALPTKIRKPELSEPSSAQQIASKLMSALLHADVDANDVSLLRSFCLSRIDTKRAPYDRFAALRDMCRALRTVAIGTTLAIAFADEQHIISWCYKGWLMAGCIALAGGFWERYLKFKPLADQALFGLFLGSETALPPK